MSLSDPHRTATAYWLGALSLLMLGAADVVHAAPQITGMSIRGFQIGATTTVTIQGTDLLPAPKLLVDLPIAEVIVAESSTPTSLEMQVTLAADVTAGLYNLRLANEQGISGHVIVAVDKLPQSALVEQIAALPVALHGTLTGSNIARTSFQGTVDQLVIVEVESQRLGGKLRPVIHLYDANRQQVDWAMPAPWLGGDARMSVSLPADGHYTLEVHDLQYAAPAPGHYRLKVGSFQFADQAFPPAVEQGKTAQVTLLGNLPSDRMVEITAPQSNQPVAAPWPESEAPSGWRPKVLTSNVPELLEAPPGENVQQLPGIPVAVSGRLDAPGQEDVFRIDVTEGAALRFEVFADRLGSPMDAVLELRNEQGGRLAQNDDFAATTDPRIDYTVPKDLHAIDVAITDQVGRGDERCIYRLLITAIDEAAKQPRFRLKVSDDTHNVPSEGTKVLQVIAERDGYDGPIRLSFDNLPGHVDASGMGIPAGSNGTLITLSATGLPTTAGLVTSIRGMSVGLDPPVTAVAIFDKHSLGELQPWMQHDIALALAPAPEIPFGIDWNNSPAESPLVIGTTMKAPLKLIRPAGAIGPVRLSLVTSEPAPIVNGNPDVNRVVRPERPTVDIAVDPAAKAAFDKLVAAEKELAEASTKAAAIRMGGETAIAAAQAALQAAREQDDPAEKLAELEAAVAQAMDKAKVDDDAAAATVAAADSKRAEAEAALRDAESKLNNAVEFNVIVPPNLVNTFQDLAVKAELRSVDNARLLAEVYTPVRRFVPLNPLSLKLPGDPSFLAKLDPQTGAVVKLAGKVERAAGFAGDVTVSLTGQPGGIAVPTMVLKPDSDAFELELKFPANFVPARVDTIKLFASGPPNPGAANIVVRTELPITVDILAADPVGK